MSVKIHPTAIVHETAVLEEGVEIGPYTIIEANVKIGKNTKIGPFCYIYERTEIGENNQLTSYVCLGGLPQDISFDPAKKTYLKIGNNNIFREFVNIHRSTNIEKPTIIGNYNFFMGVVHVAHDCVIGNHNILTQNCVLGGHVHIGNKVFVGGSAGIHQFCHIGDYSIIGGIAKVVKDVPPYMMADGNPAEVVGINIVGLKRAQFTEEQRRIIKEAYKILYRSGLTYTKAVEELETKFKDEPLIKLLTDFIKNSKRGILGGSRIKEESI